MNLPKPIVFIIMPFTDKDASACFETYVDPICRESGLDPKRADDFFSGNAIIEDIIRSIEDASIIIADVSGMNPNVFYELGIAHTLKKDRTIMITHDDFKDLPFDIKHRRILSYRGMMEIKMFPEILRETLDVLKRNYAETYEVEFNYLRSIMAANGNEGSLLILVGLNRYSKKIKVGEEYRCEGHRERNGKNIGSNGSVGLTSSLKGFIGLEYLHVVDEVISLTDKGKALAEVLEKDGFICDMFNDEVFTEGYEPGSWFRNKIKSDSREDTSTCSDGKT